MFKRLKRQIILIEIAAFLLVTVLIVGTINVNAYYQMNKNSHQILNLLAEEEGSLPEVTMRKNEGRDKDSYEFGYGMQMTIETRYTTRYFYVTVDEQGELLDYNLEHIASVTEDDVAEYAATALTTEDKEARLGNYRYLKVEEEGSTTIYFVDCYEQIIYTRYIFRVSMTVALLCMILVTIIVTFFSQKAIQPMEENIRRQKQFITDASHELKTPLAAISANVDVLELISGENEIVDKIKRQTRQMSGLVNEMLTLSRMDAGVLQKEDMERFDLSEAVKMLAADFETIAKAQGKTFILETKPDIKILAVKKDINRLMSVLMDNAVKYCTEGGKIHAILTTSGKMTQFSIRNTSEPISEGDLLHLFDRFYRTDTSRSRDTGSYGIGLSIAKSITEKHGGKILVRNEEGKVCFFVGLPMRK